MEVGGIKIPGSQAFQFGVGITAGIVLLGIVLQIVLDFIPFVGGILGTIVGIGAALVGGAIGARYAVNLVGASSNDGAKGGAVIGVVGNTLAAVVGLLIQIVLVVVNVGGGVVGGGSVGGGLVGGGVGIFLVLAFGVVGIVTGGVLAAIGGAVGGMLTGSDEKEAAAETPVESTN